MAKILDRAKFEGMVLCRAKMEDRSFIFRFSRGNSNKLSRQFFSWRTSVYSASS